MTNRRYPRDTGLSIRIAFTLLGLCLMYVPLAVWVFGWVWIAGGIQALALIGFGLLLFLLLRPLFASSLGLASGTEPLGEEEAPELRVAIERLCGLADLPRPAIALLEVDVPNAFTIGRALGENVIVVTRGLLDRLDADELEAVLAHELAHVANCDAFVMAIVSFPARLLRTLVVGFARLPLKNPAAWLVLLYFVPLVVLAWGADALATLLLMSLSRYRELVADRGAALLTGRPESLMSALQKISDRISAIPQTDLRATAGLNPFLVMPANRVSDGFDLDPFVLFPTHPTLARRIERLSGIARTLGTATAVDERPLAVDEPIRAPNPRATLAFRLAVVTWPLGWAVPYLAGDQMNLALFGGLLGMVTWVAAFVFALQGIGRAERGAVGGRLAAASLFILAAPLVFTFVGFAAIALLG